MMGNQKYYFEYLARRRFSGLLYRKFFLYPILNRYLSGDALDIGCGIGDFLKFRKGTIGTDINPYNVTCCRKRGLEAYLIENESLPFLNHQFDSVIMDNVLEHIENPSNTFNEIRRVLKSNGILLVGVPGKAGYRFDSDHKVFYDDTALKETVENEGFRSEKAFYTPLKSSFLNAKLKQYAVYRRFLKI